MADTYLVTPYRDKDQVKALGGRWDPARRQWYAPHGLDLAPFAPWLPSDMGVPNLPREQVSPIPTTRSDGLLLPSKGVSLSQLLAGVASTVAQAFEAGVWTLLEVVDVRLRNGHVYLEVSERDALGNVIAKAHAVVWAQWAGRILPAFAQATGAELAPGIRLLVRARPIFKPQYGFSLEVDAIDPAYTLGELEAKKRAIREKLQQEGVFDRNRLLPRPWDYQHVLVVAPEGGAGLGDFQAEAMRLDAWGVCHFTYVYSRFQGAGAAAEIRIALHAALEQWALNRTHLPDAVVIIRGGGAVNDLAWLDDYDLARSLCELPIPILTGIGHERDRTLIDEVAHLCFDTPSKVIAGIEQTITDRNREAQAYFAQIVQLARQTIQTLHHAIDEAHIAVQVGAQHTLLHNRQSSSDSWAEVQRQARSTLERARAQSRAWMYEITGQGPERTLTRGFTLVRSTEGQVISSAHTPHYQVLIQFHDGQRIATLGSPDAPSSTLP